MIKLIVSLLLLLAFPLLGWAADDPGSYTNIYNAPLSLEPPPGDYSVMILASIFGYVDGLLYGTSQILGTMFSVFNSAVLTLGMMLGAYVTFVSTLNTAQEGEVLGRKWSSIWIPLRMVLGFGLLMPKASGYSYIQILVMWIVLQGIGAADSIWNAVLGYMLRGGEIVQQPVQDQNLPDTNDPNHPGSVVAFNTTTMTANAMKSLVCMYAIQGALQEFRQYLIKIKNIDIGPIPDFTSTVLNFTNIKGVPPSDPVNGTDPTKSSALVYTANIPDFSTGPNATTPYALLTGICGTISWSWNGLHAFDSNTITNDNMPQFIKDAAKEVQQSLTVAVQQVVIDLLQPAQRIVANFASPNPLPLGILKIITDDTDSSGTIGSRQYPEWISPPGVDKPPLMQGTELQIAGLDFKRIIYPTFRVLAAYLITETQNQTATSYKNFFLDASMHGWLTAGKYYLELAQLNNAPDNLKQIINSFNMPEASGPTIDLSLKNGQLPQVIQNFQNASNFPIPLALQKLQFIQNTYLSDSNEFAQYLRDASAYPPLYSQSTQNQSITVPWMSLPTINIGVIAPIPEQKESKNPLAKFFIATGNTIIQKVISFINWGINVVIQRINDFLSGVEQGFTNLSNDQLNNLNPILVIAQLGSSIMNVVGTMWLVGGIGFSLITGAAGIGSALNPVPFMVLAFLTWFTPIWSFMTLMALASGIVMYYFVPFIPCIIFTFSAIGWLIGVMETMVAAPILGLALASPEGHEALGKSVNGFILLLGVFLRPSLMLFGFILGTIMSYISIWIFNYAFFHAVVTFTRMHINPIANFFGTFAFLSIYASIVLLLVNKSFSLIHRIPDEILKYIGGPQVSLGADASSGAGEIQRGVESGGKEFSGKALSKDGAASEKMLGRHEQASTAARGKEGMKIEPNSSSPADDSSNKGGSSQSNVDLHTGNKGGGGTPGGASSGGGTPGGASGGGGTPGGASGGG